METTSYGSVLVGFMADVALLAGAPLAVATVIGLIVSFLQAITQIQDQTLSQTIKIAAIAITLFAFGAVLTSPLMTSAQMVFDDFPEMVR
ncbi:flagellar biosynthetic protein FliQ [uncultured Tateyamaria sp.]|uniref:EscS/YscS/HrcS family type III secretion system export apparatus protein n=1 Tax=uncultured Tateyamaria sp. TaxID=455651 RepID=UPI002615203D|nr:flagellar biosynthetic protein FliQ [uncultured Tateyamaria sp.]